MKKQKRVLIIEDNHKLLDDYSDIVTSAGYQVTATHNLKSAIEQIDKVTFHVAIVDIGLDEHDEHNEEGLAVIDHLYELDEGTEVIILSGQSKVAVAIEAYEKYGIAQYLQKGKNKPSDITSSVETAFRKCTLKEHGKYASLTQFLANAGNATKWEHQCLSVLHPTGGILGLNKFLLELCGSFTPLLPMKNTNEPMTIHENRVYGRFWSKAIGSAVLLEGWSREKGPDIPSQQMLTEKSLEPTVRIQTSDVFGIAVVEDLDRQAFIAKN